MWFFLGDYTLGDYIASSVMTTLLTVHKNLFSFTQTDDECVCSAAKKQDNAIMKGFMEPSAQERMSR